MLSVLQYLPVSAQVFRPRSSTQLLSAITSQLYYHNKIPALPSTLPGERVIHVLPEPVCFSKQDKMAAKAGSDW